jgi:hypothetical protein
MNTLSFTSRSILVVKKYFCYIYTYLDLQNNWHTRNGFQQFPGSKLVLKAVENRCVCVNYFASRSTSRYHISHKQIVPVTVTVTDDLLDTKLLSPVSRQLRESQSRCLYLNAQSKSRLWHSAFATSPLCSEMPFPSVHCVCETRHDHVERARPGPVHVSKAVPVHIHARVPTHGGPGPGPCVETRTWRTGTRL